MRIAATAAVLVSLGLSLSGCAVVAVADTAVSITSKVVGTAVDVTGDVVGAAADAATGGGSSSDDDKKKKSD